MGARSSVPNGLLVGVTSLTFLTRRHPVASSLRVTPASALPIAPLSGQACSRKSRNAAEVSYRWALPNEFFHMHLSTPDTKTGRWCGQILVP